MCFDFYQDLSGILSWNKSDKYRERRYKSTNIPRLYGSRINTSVHLVFISYLWPRPTTDAIVYH